MSVNARAFTAGPKKLWKIRTGPPGRRGPWAAGPRACLAKPDELNIGAGKNVLACF